MKRVSRFSDERAATAAAADAYALRTLLLCSEATAVRSALRSWGTGERAWAAAAAAPGGPPALSASAAVDDAGGVSAPRCASERMKLAVPTLVDRPTPVCVWCGGGLEWRGR